MALLTAIFLYCIGTLLIGYPAAYMKLHIWKYPGRHPVTQKIFFGRMPVGTPDGACADPWRQWAALHEAIHGTGSRRPLGEYILLTSLGWPLVILEVLLGLILLPVTAIDWARVIGENGRITGV